MVSREIIDTAPFDHSRDYFRLFLKTEDEIISVVRDYPGEFSREEILILCDIDGPLRRLSEEGRGIIMELLPLSNH